MDTTGEKDCFICASPLPRDTVTTPETQKIIEEFWEWTREFTQSEGRPSPGGKREDLQNKGNNWSGTWICACCEEHVQSAVERQKAVEETEALVRRLQLQLLEELRQLQRRLQELYGDMKGVGDRMEKTGEAEPRCGRMRTAVMKVLECLEEAQRKPYFLLQSEVNAELEVEVEVEGGSTEDDGPEDLFKVIEELLPEFNSCGDEELFPLETPGGDDEKPGKGKSEKKQSRPRRPPIKKPIRVPPITKGMRPHRRRSNRESKEGLHGPPGESTQESESLRLVRKRGFTNLSCGVCGRSQYCEAALVGHLINVHLVEPEIPAKHRCPTCGLCSASKSMYQQHQKVHLTPGAKVMNLLPCPACKKEVFARFYNEHLVYCNAAPKAADPGFLSNQTVEQRSPKRSKKALPFQIDTGPVGVSAGECESEKKKTSPGGDHRFVCEFCGKVAATETFLQRHTLQCRDLEGQQYQCDLCSAPPFKDVIKLTVHRNRHLNNDKRPHVCERCGGDFLRSSHLYRHQRHCNGTKKPRKPRYSNMTQPVSKILRKKPSCGDSATGEGPSKE